MNILDTILNFLSPYKVALQIAGMPRSWREDYPNFKKNLLDPLKPDVFIHTWITGETDVEEFNFCRKYNAKKSSREVLRLSGFPMINQMKAMKLVEHGTKPENAVPMLYSRWACNELRKAYEFHNNVKYDIIILARTEISMDRCPTRKELELAKTKMLIPRGFNSIGYNDLFAICSREGADVYTSCFKKINELIFDNYTEFQAHSILKKVLDDSKIPIERIKYPIYLRSKPTWD